MEMHSWRGTAFQFPRRLDWLNPTWTPIGEAKIDHTTLFDFYCRLEKDDTARDLFNELISKFVKLCGTSLKKQRTDSFFIHGWLQILSRYGLLKETIQKFLFELQKKIINDFTKVERKLSKKYLEKIINTTHNTDAEFTRKNKQKVTGHKDFVSEACAESNETQFITDVNFTGSTNADSKGLSEIHDKTEKADLKPEKQYVDAGFVIGGTIISSFEQV